MLRDNVNSQNQMFLKTIQEILTKTSDVNGQVQVIFKAFSADADRQK